MDLDLIKFTRPLIWLPFVLAVAAWLVIQSKISSGVENFILMGHQFRKFETSSILMALSQIILFVGFVKNHQLIIFSFVLILFWLCVIGYSIPHIIP